MILLNKIIYFIFIHILYGVFYLASFFNSKAKKWIKGRSNFPSFPNKKSDSKRVWMHVASLGEYEQGLPVLNELKKKYPNYEFIISFFSPSGYEVIKTRNQEDTIFYIPLDTPSNAKKLIQNLKPDVLFLVKYDYWYFILNELQKQKIPIYVISAKFSSNFIGFKNYATWFKRIIQKMDFIFVQDDLSLKILKNNNIDRAILSGDTRFDRVKELLNVDKNLNFIDEFKKDKLLFVAGSTWNKDEKIITEAFLSLNSDDLKLIIVPHEINNNSIKKLQSQFNKCILYSEINGNNLANYQVLIIDTVGLLTRIYSYSNLSYVGGGFDKDGIHNVLEPAVFKQPVLFGPNIKKFDEAKKLINANGAIIINNSSELEKKLNNFIQNRNEIDYYGENAQKMILETPPSTKTILDSITF